MTIQASPTQRAGTLARRSRRSVVLLASTLALALASCSETPPQMPPMAVSYVVAKAENTPLFREYPGQIQAQNEVQIRPRVAGIVIGRSFVEGGFVRKGQPLFQIDPRELRAQVAGAQAQLAGARAMAARAQQDVARYGPLVKADAIARQVYDTAVASSRAADAQVRAAAASVDQAQVGLSYTVVRSPMNGQIGESLVDVGSLVSPSGPEMARVSDSDPIAVYFNPGEQELLEFQNQSASGQQTAGNSLRLMLADGSEYPHPGRVDFADRALNPQTGSLEVRAVFPNPDGLMRSGMFGRIRLQFSERINAVIVPDRAVIDQLGTRFVYVVGKDNKVAQRKVETGPHIGGTWVINSGVKAGERILVDGQQKVQPGMVVNPQPAQSPEAKAPQQTRAQRSEQPVSRAQPG